MSTALKFYDPNDGNVYFDIDKCDPEHRAKIDADVEQFEAWQREERRKERAAAPPDVRRRQAAHIRRVRNERRNDPWRQQVARFHARQDAMTPEQAAEWDNPLPDTGTDGHIGEFVAAELTAAMAKHKANPDWGTPTMRTDSGSVVPLVDPRTETSVTFNDAAKYIDWVTHSEQWDTEMDKTFTAARDVSVAIGAEVERRAKGAGVHGYQRHHITQQPESNNPDNVEYLLRSLQLAVRFNAWLERVEIKGGGPIAPNLRWSDWTYFDDRVMDRLLTHAARTGTRFCPAVNFAWTAIQGIAAANTVDPARDRLAALESAWDGTPRLDKWLSATCGVPNDAYHRAVSRNVIGSMVRRIRQPGCKADLSLVLIGPQGTGKSTLAATLALEPSYFTDNVRLGDEAKELVLSLAGKCVAEISEMGARTADINAIKAMLSRQTDAGRTAYARSVTERPRRNIFICSTNSDTPLIDDTGNRRWLPVQVAGEIDLAFLSAHRDQLIGEGAALESQGDTFAMPRDVWADAAVRQNAARAVPEWEMVLGEWLGDTDAVFVTAADLSELVRSAAGGRTVDARFYGKTMRALGFEQDGKRVDGKTCKVWFRGSKTAANRYVLSNDGGRARPVLRLSASATLPPPPMPPAALPL